MTDGPWADFQAAPAQQQSAGPWTDFAASPVVGAAPTAPPQMSAPIPAIDPTTGFPTGEMIPSQPMAPAMPYGEQMAHVGNAFLSAGERIGANVPFADRASAGISTLLGNGTYAENLAKERAATAEAQAANPSGEAAAKFIGETLAPAGAVGKVAQGANLAQRVIRGMTLGGLLGGSQAASNVQDFSNPTTQDVTNFAKGAGIGTLVGAGAPVVGAGLGAAWRGLSNAINGNVVGIDAPARDYLIRALMADNPATVQQELARLGPSAMPVDAGPSLKGIGMGLGAGGQLSPAESMVIQALKNRNAGTNTRLNSALDAALGPARVPQFENEAINAARSGPVAGVHSQLPQIFANAPPVDTSNVLATIGQGLTTARGPEASVLNKARDWLMEPVQGGGVTPVRDAETLQNAKLAIDKLIDYGDTSLGVPSGAVSKAQGAIGNVRAQLDNALRQQVPGYANVMDQSSALARQADALAAGKNDILAGGENPIHPDVYARDFSLMSPEEQEAQRIGMRGAIDQAVGGKANNLQVVRNLLQGDNGWNSQKLATAFGQQPAQAVSQAADAEATMRDTFNKIVENSQTARRQAMAKALQQAAPLPQDLIPDPSRVTGFGAALKSVVWPANQVINAFRSVPDYAARDMQLANAVTSQGPARDELIRQLLRAGQNRQANALAGNQISNASMLAGALAPNVVLNADQQRVR